MPGSCLALARLLLVLLMAAPGGTAAVRGIRAAELKQRLRRFGISTADVFEKEELVALLSTRVAPEAAGTGHCVPLELASARAGAMGAGVSVDSKSYYGLRFDECDGVLWLIDSAASNSVLSPAAADHLGARATGVVASASTASETTGGFKQVDLGDVSTFGLACGPLKPVVMPLPVGDSSALVGLLGLDFLSRFECELRLRAEMPCATLHPSGAISRSDVQLDAMVPLSCTRLPTGLLAARVRVGSSRGEAEAVIDLGSSVTVASMAAAAVAGLTSDDPRLRLTDTVIAGASGEPIRTREARLDLSLGDGGEPSSQAQRRLQVSVADLPVFGALGMRGAAMVLGIDALAPNADAAGSRVVLAAGRDQVWVEVA